MHALLLGGWRDVVEDVRRLAAALAHLPASCSRGNGSAHLTGACPCDRSGEGNLDDRCTDCEALLGVIREEMDDLIDRTLRFLPFLERESGVRSQVDHPDPVAHLRRQILEAAETFQQIENAGGEYRHGCSTLHLSAMKTLANQLVIEADRVDRALREIPPLTGAWNARGRVVSG